MLLIGASLFGFSSVRTFGSFNNISYEVFFSEYTENTYIMKNLQISKVYLKLNQNDTLIRKSQRMI